MGRACVCARKFGTLPELERKTAKLVASPSCVRKQSVSPRGLGQLLCSLMAGLFVSVWWPGSLVPEKKIALSQVRVD
jgi:hypothetical protein